ncbi:MAG TPA: thioesterase family protein [Bacilli bacterium]
MENIWHQHILRARYQETDQMGVVHHANYLGWFETGRTEWLRSAGSSYHQLESLGLFLPLVDLSIKYRKPAHYDDLIAVYTSLTDFSAVRVQFDYEVRRIADAPAGAAALQSGQHAKSGEGGFGVAPEGELLSSGSSRHMWLNREWKPARLDKIAPEVFRLLQSYLRRDAIS